MTTRDVIVIGAGLAGLAAARVVARGGYSLAVLEARSRPGGRVFSTATDSRSATTKPAAAAGAAADTANTATLDRGAQWIGPGQTRMYSLVKEFGLTLIPTYVRGKHIHQHSGEPPGARGDSQASAEATTSRWLLPAVGTPGRLDFIRLATLLGIAARQIPLEAPWLAPEAVALDTQSLTAWLRARAWSTRGCAALEAQLEDLFCAPLAQVSALEALHQLKSVGGVLRLSGAETHFIAEGTFAVASALAAQLGASVHYACPAETVRHAPGAFEVRTPQGTFNSKQLIVACPPPLWASLGFEPALPAWTWLDPKQRVTGAVLKAAFTFAAPFWRERGLSGYAHRASGVPSTVIDASVPERGHFALVTLTSGARARELGALSAATRHQALLDGLRRMFGACPDPLQLLETDWTAEPYSLGGYASRPALGVWTSRRRPLGETAPHLSFACTETAWVWRSYMEGAVRAGESAAEQALKRFREA